MSGSAQILLSVTGSSYFDQVARDVAGVDVSLGPLRAVLCNACYLTSGHISYQRCWPSLLVLSKLF